MNTTLPPPTKNRSKAGSVLRVLPQPVTIPPLQSGDEMDADEFFRRYKATPGDFKAELIDGVVYIMLAFVRAQFHGEPDNLIQVLLGTYSIGTTGTKCASNSTTRLGLKDMPQPRYIAAVASGTRRQSIP